MHTFEKLEAKDQNGNPYEYKVVRVDVNGNDMNVADRYDSNYIESSYFATERNVVIVNKYISINKVNHATYVPPKTGID